MQLKIFLEKLLIKEQKTEKYNQWKLTTGTKTSKQKANTLDFILELTGHLHADFSLKILKINFTCHQNKKMKQKMMKHSTQYDQNEFLGVLIWLYLECAGWVCSILVMFAQITTKNHLLFCWADLSGTIKLYAS